MPRLLTALLAAALCAAAAAGSARAAVRSCPSSSIGPGAIRRDGDAGAVCLLAAFRNGCRATEYVLSSFGVDTVHSETFRLERRNGACVVVVSESFRVVPQQPHVTAAYSCRRVRAYVADRCTPSATLSLTKLSG